MSVNNNGFNVVISGINTLSNFTASNVKIQDNYIYTITNNTKGNDANGAMLLSRSGANNIILDGRNTYICTVAQLMVEQLMILYMITHILVLKIVF